MVVQKFRLYRKASLIVKTFGSSRFDLNCAQLFIATWLNTNIKPKTLPIIGWIRSVHKQHTMLK
jgi:hypothetical protein